MGTVKNDTRRFLIAVDDSENAIRSVRYCANFLRELNSPEVVLLHIIQEPDEDFFAEAGQKPRWLETVQAKADTMLRDYQQMMVHRGIEPSLISRIIRVSGHQSIAEAILNENKVQDAGTIVVGRRGVSQREEFLFGSTSSRIVHYARNCAIWVIE
jgi:nucleotide-binding universal stress UspA family protein